MIEHELELAGQGRLQELQDAVARDRRVHGDAAVSGSGVRAAVGRARQGAAGRVTIEARRLQEGIELSRGALRRARRISKTYSPAARKPLLDDGLTAAVAGFLAGLKPSVESADLVGKCDSSR